MVEAIKLKKGMIFSQKGKLIQVLKSDHHKPGKGNTVMEMDLRELKSGAVVHKTMRPTEKVDLVELIKRPAQYLYGQGDSYTFMDKANYNQYEVSKDQLGNDVKFLTPNISVDLEFTGDQKLIGVQLPATVVLKVKQTGPEIKSATVAGGGKPATMETGLVVEVPPFVKEGDKLIIGTEKGDYKSRDDGDLSKFS